MSIHVQPLSAMHRPAAAGVRARLLQGVSLSALALAAAAPPARAASFKSLAQAISGAHIPAPVIAAQTGGGAVAARQAGLGAQNFANAATRFRSLAQALAVQPYQGVPIPDGVTPGGLQQAPGIIPGISSTLWSGASTSLSQTLANGITDVTVNQTQSVAALTWKSLNVGARTKLIFNQAATNWVAINSVQDPTANPTTILGQISAPGKVFILNPNGILFGAGSQVNVGGLIATSANIAESQFTRDTNGLIKSFSLYGTVSAGGFAPTFIGAPAAGEIAVQPGATIATPVPTGTNGGGYVMLLGGSVQNQGVISTPQGQTVLGAGTNFILQAGYSANNPTATVVGSQVAVTNPTGSIIGSTTLGSVANSGIVIADQGDITMVGHTVTQSGVLLATTTIDSRGTVHLLTDSGDASASVTLTPGSVTEIMPEELYSLSINGTSTLVTALENSNAPSGILQTALNAQRATNLSASAADNSLRTATATGPRLNDYNDLTDTLGESRIEISTGGTMEMQGGALALAQGGQVAVNAAGSILVENGATIDVSGTNATLPASANSLFVQGIVPYYLRDSAANRTTLEFANVYIDERTLQEISSGAYAGNIYTQGGLLEVSGNLGLVGHGINEWTSVAGQVTLQSVVTKGGVSTGGTVAVSSGATINLTGGTVTYQAGLVHQSYVQSVDGRIFNINNAPGDLLYTGVYTGQQENHPRWHITNTFINPLLTPMEVQAPQYSVGRDAGSLTVSAATALLEGTIAGGVTVGQNQTGARPSSVSDPFLLAQTVVPQSGALAVGAYDGGVLLTPQFLSTVLIARGGATNGGGTETPVALPTEAITGTIAIDSNTLNDAGFANVSILTAGDLTLAGSLALADGGTLTLGAGTVAIDAGITVHSGRVILTNLQSPTQVLSSTPGSISIAAGAVIDASGEWTNLLVDPNDRTLIGYANGGMVSLVSTGGLDLAAGGVIDVSSGGQLSIAGKLTAAAGGNLAISADILPGTVTSYYPQGDVVLDGTVAGYASGAGGTLSVTAPDIVLGDTPQHLFAFNPGAVVTLPDNALFSTGFSNYVLNGYFGLEVDSDRHVVATRPTYVLTNPDLRTGGAAAGAYSVLLAPVYTANYGNDTISQRAGAGIALESTINPTLYNGGGGPIFIDPGAQVAVDPGQSITVAGYGQVTEQGTLTAHGGTITLANTRFEEASPPTNVAPNDLPGLSVWIGDLAIVDASGVAVAFTDVAGRVFGQAQAGGTILLGGLAGQNAASQQSTYAQVIERPYATLDAQGASLTVDSIPSITDTILNLPVPVTLAGNGGTILARSYSGIALDGVMNAAGEGPNAAGGTLTLRMDLLDVADLRNRPDVANLPDSYTAGSRILISQNEIDVQTTPYLTPGQVTDPDTVLLGRVSQAQLDQGGFYTLNLFAQDFIAFDADAALHLARAVTMQAPILGDTQTQAHASIAAPYVRLFGKDTSTYGSLSAGGTLLTPGYAQATLTIDAGTIDMTGNITLGGAQNVGGTGAPGFVVPGFQSADLVSTGDLRFLLSPDLLRDTLDTPGDITLQAAQIYPATNATAFIYAGDNRHIAINDRLVNQFEGGTITVLGQAGAAPQSPFSVNGTLALVSDVVVQDGVLRAPEGNILLGASTGDLVGVPTIAQQITDRVMFGPHSITSVSLDGQIVPYGGTVDGVNYTYAGAPVATFTPTITIGAAEVIGDPTGQIDLRGGGTLAGAGFIPGRGGTADVNTTPLLNSLSGTVVANTSNPVFAIVPGYQAAEAPVAPGDAGYTAPAAGEQITIGAGEVAGLPAGTYTLLPAYYDLLPGAYRIELTNAAIAPGSSLPFGNFTRIAAVRVGTAGTGVIGSLPQAALITSGTDVRQLSQYDEESYNDFEVTSAQTFGAGRPDLPQDAKTLQIALNLPTGTVAVAQPIDIDAGSLLKTPTTFTVGGVAGIGHGATVAITGAPTNSPILAVLGEGDSIVPYVTNGGTVQLLAVEGLADSALDALTAGVAVPFGDGSVEIGTRLVLGGTLTTANGTVTIVGQSPDVLVQQHADLTAADTILTVASSRGTIDVITGATIDGSGAGTYAVQSGTGLLINTDRGVNGGSSPVLAISNNDLQFLPTQDGAPFSLIQVGADATLRAAPGGSLNFAAPSGTSVQVAPSNLIASYVTVQVSNIDVGSDASLAEFASLLPGGLTLTDTSLNTLAQNATVLSLTAQQSVNLLGDVALNAGNTNLVLNTPAIYGYGITAAGDGAPELLQGGTISITAPNINWSGVSSNNTLQTGNTTAVSATPGGRLAGSVLVDGTNYALTDAASLTIDATGRAASGTLAATAGTLTLGYSAQARANDQVQLDRLVTGFADVTLAASGEITANNQSSLSVYATQTTLGQPGTGGDLSLLAPLLTTDSGSILKLNAGGAFTAASPGAAAATGNVAALGGEIAVAANTIDTATSIALPAGRLSLTADAGIDIGDGTNIDLAGRATPIFDQTVYSNGGTLLLEDSAAGNTNITETAGAVIDVASPGGHAGLISATDASGAVLLGGALQGAGAAGGGSITVLAGSLGPDGTPSPFETLNDTLNANGFSGLRAFELTQGDISVGSTQTILAHTVRLAADAGNVTIAGTIDAAGAAPGSISLAAGGALTLDATAVLDAHATRIAVDSYGAPIDAENRAHVSLSSAGGSVILTSGATIDVSYPGSDPQGQLVIDAPRTQAGDSLMDVAVSATGPLNIIGARAIDLFAFRIYTPRDANGTIVQDNTANGPPAGALGLVQIGQDNTAFMAQVDSDGASLAGGQLSGLAAYGASFHLAPGVQITSDTAGGGNLTISGDLDFSGLRYSDPVQFGSAVQTGVAGSGEPGAIVFRASNNLAVNGSVTDGFLAPPDTSLTGTNILVADIGGWNIYDNPARDTAWTDPTNSDLLLPSSAYGTYTLVKKGPIKVSTQIVLLGATDGTATTVFDTTRPISLNYDITIQSASLKSGVVIPFGLMVNSAFGAIPAGGWVATSSIARDGVVLFQPGQLIPAGFRFAQGDVLGAGAVLPVSVQTAGAQLIPAGTSFNIFSDATITLAADTAPLPANALIPSASQDFFGVAYSNNGTQAVAPITTLYLRSKNAGVEGYLYPLAQMLPADQQSWSMDFVAGANEAGAAADAVQPLTTLDGGALAVQANTINQAPGSLLIDDQHYFSYTAKQAAGGFFNGDPAVTAFSVIRTGTGDLSLVAGGNIDQSSLYGIYTAGTQDSTNTTGDYNPARQALGPNGQLLPNLGTGKKQVDESALSTLVLGAYQANYPTNGGDVLVRAQGNMTGDVYADPSGFGNTGGSGADASDVVGNWLWREGGPLSSATAWWINFGTLVDPLLSTGGVAAALVPIQMTGFQGIGALGGGNVTVAIGGDAGNMTDRASQSGSGIAAPVQAGEGLVIAVGSTGRIVDGALVTTGGGDVSLTIGGALNPIDAAAYNIGATAATTTAQNQEAPAVDGDLIDTRGNITASAGAIGRVDYVYNSGLNNIFDPRSVSPYAPNDGIPNSGIAVIPGDGTVSITTDRDLVISGAGDPGREPQQALAAASSEATNLPAGCSASPDSCGVIVGFSLWQPGTSISLFSAGGNVTPTTLPNQAVLTAAGVVGNTYPEDFRNLYPPTLLVTAATGNIIYGQDGINPALNGLPSSSSSSYPFIDYSLETMPAANGQVAFLAGRSIFANGYAIDISGAEPLDLSSISIPAYAVTDGVNIGDPTNVLAGPESGLNALSLFALEADTPTSDLHEADPDPARFYAADGDIVNFQTGQTLNFVLNASLEATWYLAAKPAWIIASNDIVSTGNRPGVYPADDPSLFAAQENQNIAPSLNLPGDATVYSSGNLFLNNTSNETSVISAGRDILSAYGYVLGSGLLEVDAGRNLFQAAYAKQNGSTTQQTLYFGSLKSLGGNFTTANQTSLGGGASIAVLAGTGVAGPDYTDFANLYFDPANQANLSLPISDPANKGKVQQVYTTQLVAWLAANFGYMGDATGALAAFQALPAIDQAVFVRAVFFDELTASGAQEADPSSRFFKDFLRGQTAIDTLLPGVGATNQLGVPAGYTGGITAYSGPITLTNSDGTNRKSYTVDGGIATLFGGDVQILDPGGNIEFGIPGGPAPGNNSGIITYGAGDIDIYALDSVLLGKSRIFATGGGDITIWSSIGDINAGIGAKTTISYNPPLLSYDDVGDVTQSPPASTSGAGIATLQPLPSVPAGNVSLIAPAGTVDAGEAGVRVSGDLVLAAARVSGTANITVNGSTTGAPTVSVASIGAVEAAGAAAGAGTNAAATNAGHTADTREVASILDVEVISVGGTPDDERKKKKRAGLP